MSATLLMTELALTRIFSVVMYYHFAFLAISIALFGLSASGVFAYVARRRLDRYSTDTLLSTESLIYAATSIVALFFLVRLRVGLNYSPKNLALMLTIYALAALPFFTGGLVVTLAISRLSAQINAVYAADLIGAAAGCLILIPLLDRLGAPGVVLSAAALSIAAGVAVRPARLARAHRRARRARAPRADRRPAFRRRRLRRRRHQGASGRPHPLQQVEFVLAHRRLRAHARRLVAEPRLQGTAAGHALHGHRLRRVDADPRPRAGPVERAVPALRAHGAGVSHCDGMPASSNGPSSSTSPGFTALVIGPGGGRDLASALVFGASRVDGVEINPIIANEVMRERLREFSGGIYTHPRVRIAVDDGRSFVRRTPERYDVIQASLVDTWAATAAGAYTLTENTLYTVEAFNDYLDHLTDGGVLTITRWVADGLRLVSLAQAACDARGWSAADRLAIVRHDRVATFLLKRTPFTPAESAHLRDVASRLGFDVLYAPDAVPAARPQTGGSQDMAPDASDVPNVTRPAQDVVVDGASTGDYARLVLAGDREQFYAAYRSDIRPTTDDRPFFFHTTKLEHQFDVAFGRSMLFGNGLSALMTLLGISTGLVALFIVGPLVLSARGTSRPHGWLAWLVYFGALGAGFMLIEVSVLQRFVLLLGHPVYSLTVTLFSLLLGTGLGAAWSRRFDDATLRRTGVVGVTAVAVLALGVIAVATPIVAWAIPFSRELRMLIAVAMLVPLGVALGIPMPTGLRMLSARAPHMVAWAWGMNGALSVLGATLAIFIAMNWGFRVTLLAASATYLVGLAALLAATRPQT